MRADFLIIIFSSLLVCNNYSQERSLDSFLDIMHLIDPDYRNDFVLYCEHSFKRLNKQKSSVRKKKIRFLEEQALCDIHIHKPDLVSMASDTIIGQEEGSFLCFYSLLNHYKKERYTTVNGSAFRLVSYIKDTALIWHGWFKSI